MAGESLLRSPQDRNPPPAAPPPQPGPPDNPFDRAMQDTMDRIIAQTAAYRQKLLDSGVDAARVDAMADQFHRASWEAFYAQPGLARNIFRV